VQRKLSSVFNGASNREGNETARSRRQVRRGAASFRGTSPNASLGGKSDSIIGAAYAWFLELPVPIVLMTMWLAGVVLIGGSLVGLLYLLMTMWLAGVVLIGGSLVGLLYLFWVLYGIRLKSGLS